MKSTASQVRTPPQVFTQTLTKMLYLPVLLWLLTPAVCTASGVEGTSVQERGLVRLSIEGISASVGENEPRVLTILPWRAPTLPRRPRVELEGSAPELVQPLDPVVFERHRKLRQGGGVAAGASADTSRAVSSGERAGGQQ